MSEISIVDLQNLTYFNRLDADFYKPSYLKIYKILQKLKEKYDIKKLTELIICPVRTGATPKEREPLNDGTDVLFIKTDSVRKGFINYEAADLLPLEAHKKRKLTALKYGDIVVTIIGATHEIIGRAGLYLMNEPANINQSDVLIRVDTNKIEAGYLSTFINCKYGRTQLWRYSGQTGQVTMNCREVEELLIPILPKSSREKIHNLIIDSGKLREEAKKIYNEARQLFIKELNFQDLEIKRKLTYSKKCSEINFKDRIDAEFYHPRVIKLMEHLRIKFNAKPLGAEIPNITTGQYVEEYLDNGGRPFIRSSDIQNGTIDDSALLFVSPKLQKQSKKAKRGDVVVTRVGSIGLAARIPNELEGSTISDNLIRIRIENENVDSYYLTTYLDSKIGQELMIVFSRGSVQQRLNQETLKSIPLPIMTQEKQKEISNLVQKSQEFMQKAKRLLDEAKISLEQEIKKLAT